MKKILFVVTMILFLCGLFFSNPSEKKNRSEKRVALVIGNSKYTQAPLKNPINDAIDMAEVLKKKGFEVILITNANHIKIETNIRKFGNKLRRADVGLFYYAGHGIQVKGTNYLIPVEADIQAEHEVKHKAVPAEYVLGEMENANSPMNIVILDACRDNPFARSFRSTSRGLARMDAPKGTIIIYSTSPGKVAQDGSGRNAPFTKYLLKEIQKSSLEIDPLLRRVREQVLIETNNKQMPWAETSLIGQFFFNPPSPQSSGQLSPPPQTQKLDLSHIQLKAKWDKWQLSFKKAVEQARQIDENAAINPKRKKETWQLLKNNFEAENPFSRQDNTYRKQIDHRIKFWSKKIAPGILQVLALPYAQVFINGQSYGEVPPQKKIRLEAGQYQVVLKMAGQSFEKIIDIHSNQTETIHHHFDR